MSLRNTITRLFRFALTAANEGLIAAWNLSSTADSFGANTLTNNNVVTFVAGKINNAAHFDGVNQFLSIADNSDLSLGAGIFCVFSGWFKLETLPAGANRATIIAKSDTSLTNTAYIIDVTSTGVFRFIVSADGAALTTLQSAAGLIAANTWYFFVCWYDGTNIYYEINNNGTIASTAFSTDIFNDTSDLCIGARNSTTHFLTGLIDAVRFYKSTTRCITAAERSMLYNSGAGREYVANTTISSDEVNRELNQILNLISGISIDTTLFSVVDLEEACLTINQNGVGPLMQLFSNTTLVFEIDNNGTIKSYLPTGNPPIVISNGQNAQIENLNVDLLNGLNASDILQTTSYLPLCSSAFFNGTPVVGDRVLLVMEGNTLFQVKTFQRGVASSDAITVINLLSDVNIEVSLGSIELNGNSTAIITENLGDIALAETTPTVGVKRIIAEVAAISGTLKHSDITVSLFAKQLPF